MAEIRTCPTFYAYSRYLQVYKGSDKKYPRKGGDIIFPIISQCFFCCHGNQSFDPICPKTLCSLSPTPQIWSRLAHWLKRYSSSKVWNFRHWRASTSKMSCLIRPEIELDQTFMPVLVYSNFDDDSIKNERASMETAFSHYKSMGFF